MSKEKTEKQIRDNNARIAAKHPVDMTVDELKIHVINHIRILHPLIEFLKMRMHQAGVFEGRENNLCNDISRYLNSQE
jgi:hypothetical protein